MARAGARRAKHCHAEQMAESFVHIPKTSKSPKTTRIFAMVIAPMQGDGVLTMFPVASLEVAAKTTVDVSGSWILVSSCAPRAKRDYSVIVPHPVS
jgi:hypothetical protein